MGFSDEMKAICDSLAQSRSDRQKVMAELQSGFSRDRMQRKGALKRLFGDVHVMIQHFHTDRGKMSEEMRTMLQKNVRSLLREFRAQHKAMSGKQAEELKAFFNGLRREVGQMRRALQADFRKAHEYWMGFAKRMQAAKVAPRPGRTGLQSRIMAALKGSPEGMTTKELSYALGMSERGLTRTLMRLRREGDIRKRKSTFFAR